jgi:hypothetical protein
MARRFCGSAILVAATGTLMLAFLGAVPQAARGESPAAPRASPAPIPGFPQTMSCTIGAGNCTVACRPAPGQPIMEVTNVAAVTFVGATSTHILVEVRGVVGSTSRVDTLLISASASCQFANMR